MPAGSIILRSPRGRTAFSENNSGLGVPAGHWRECIPFVVNCTTQFCAPPPPEMTSAAYTDAYNEAKNLGGDGIITPTQRTEEQTFIGTFWAYDGTPSLCAPPRLYNQITVQI